MSATSFLMHIVIAVGLLFIGLGQGLALNVKDSTFKSGMRLCGAEIVLLSAFMIIFVREVSLTAIADGFLFAGTLIGLISTRDQRSNNRILDEFPTRASKIDTAYQDPRITRTSHRVSISV